MEFLASPHHVGSFFRFMHFHAALRTGDKSFRPDGHHDDERKAEQSR